MEFHCEASLSCRTCAAPLGMNSVPVATTPRDSAWLASETTDRNKSSTQRQWQHFQTWISYATEHSGTQRVNSIATVTPSCKHLDSDQIGTLQLETRSPQESALPSKNQLAPHTIRWAPSSRAPQYGPQRCAAPWGPGTVLAGTPGPHHPCAPHCEAGRPSPSGPCTQTHTISGCGRGVSE